MGAETVRTELRVSGDARVRAGVRAALEHIGARHGLSKTEQRGLAEEADAKCCKALGAQPVEARYCHVLIDELEDRLEVRITAAAPAVAREDNANHKPESSNTKHGQASRNGEPQANLGHAERCAIVVRHFQKTPAHS